MTLAITNLTFTAGTPIVATQMNTNFSEIQTYINTSVMGAAGGTITGAVVISSNLTVTGFASLGANNQVYISPTEEVTGLAAGTDITTNDAASFLNARNYPVGSNTAQPYASNRHRFTKYDTTAGEGNPAGSIVDRPESQYRLVINGSIAIRGDIIGYTSQNTGYNLGEGTRIESQGINVRDNLDVGGYIRVMTKFDYARLFMGNDYAQPGEDWLEWHDNIHSSQPGFGFHINGSSATNMSGRILSISKDSSNYVDVRAPIGQYPASTGPITAGWPTISGSYANIDTSTQRLGISSSSIRFKEDVEDIASDTNWTKLKALKPRTFRWNREVAERSSLHYETQTPELGFIAEEVHEVAPDMILYDADGDPIVYRDKSMLAMLVKAVQDLDERVEALG
jgi:hypothetical protein